MTKETMIKNYREFAAHDAYIIVFKERKDYYFYKMNEIPPRMINVEHEASKKGGNRKLQLRIHAADIHRMVKNGATKIDHLPTERVKGGNKGVAAECYIREYYGQPFRGKDSIGFWHDGDLTVDGIKYQIKLNGAQIVTEKTLETLKLFKRKGITPPPQIRRGTVKKLLENRG